MILTPLRETDVLGKLFVPELSRTQFLPGKLTGRSAHHIGVVRYEIRRHQEDGSYRPGEPGYGIGIVPYEGLREKWRASEDLQRNHRGGVDEMLAIAYAHNERVDNGGKMIGKSFWGITTTPTNATVNAPTRIAICNLNGFAPAHGDQSLGTSTANSTTNEFTTNGLSRTSSLTPSGWTAPSALDGTFLFTISNIFTDSGGASTFYGCALMDNTTGAFNMFMESQLISATLQVGDLLTPTVTVRG